VALPTGFWNYKTKSDLSILQANISQASGKNLKPLKLWNKNNNSLSQYAVIKSNTHLHLEQRLRMVELRPFLCTQNTNLKRSQSTQS
jgi:hypothetical protein